MNELDKILQNNPTETDVWESLKAFTSARIALGKTGVSMPLKETLSFKMAHAHARDAVYSTLDETRLLKDLNQFNLPVFLFKSKANTRHEYLQRPDWGRHLDEISRSQLKDFDSPSDVAIIMADGLSATAINEHAVPLLRVLIPMLQQSAFSTGPLSIVQQGRVAIADDIGFLLKTRLAVILIGERPGLSSPDSMGAYLTYNPSVGLTDESRNCISNIRTEGLSYTSAAEKILFLIKESFRLKYSGVALKDNSGLLT